MSFNEIYLDVLGLVFLFSIWGKIIHLLERLPELMCLKPYKLQLLKLNWIILAVVEQSHRLCFMGSAKNRRSNKGVVMQSAN